MRKEFNKLVEVMQKFDIYQLDDEVGIALNDLSDKIVEVEKRMECIEKCADEINDAIGKYTERVDKNETFVMSVSDHDSIMRGSHDIEIALDLNDKEVIENNWYSLFSPTEEPTKQEVFMTFESSWGFISCDKDGNVIEVIGDKEIRGEQNYLYDIVKIDLAEYNKFLNSIGKELDHDSDDILSVGFWKKDNTYNEADMDLRKDVFSPEDDEEPTKKESAFEFESSCGTIECDIDGRVLKVNGDLEINGKPNWLFDIIKFDIEEYSKYCSKNNITHGESLDILTVGYWRLNDEYIMPDEAYRFYNTTEAQDRYIDFDEPPTDLCKTPQTHEFVKDIIAKLKVIDVDGETMEYILKQVGMEAQMLRQLFVKTTNDDIDELIDERILYNRYSNHLV